MFTADASHFTGWVTTIDGQRFLYAKGDGSDEYFTYPYKLEGKDLIVSNLALVVGGMDAVTSTETYRAEASASMKTGKGIVDPVRFVRE